MSRSVHPKFKAVVSRDGKVSILDRHRFDATMQKYFCGMDVAIVVMPWYDSRSEKENKYYWGVVIEMIAQHTGDFNEDVHRAMKRKFMVRSTVGLTTRQMEEYIEKIKIWAAMELGINIPDPDKATGE